MAIKKGDKKMKKKSFGKKVTVTFIYDIVKGKDEQYYRNRAFDDIYNADDVLNDNVFIVEDLKHK